MYLQPSLLVRTVASALLPFATVAFAATTSEAPASLKQYCFSCHGKAGAVAGLNLDQLTRSHPGEQFQVWEKIATAIETKRMPPAQMPQPSDADRKQAVSWIRASLKEYAAKHANDPGRVTVRRLTSAEYGYSIQDLTGLELKVDRDFVADSVGGEGFTNFGDVQFMQDASLERYLQSAKYVAERAMLGAGPMYFHADPGKSGLELSAIQRIQDIYMANGFRATSGEGGKPYGIYRYGNALYACWRYANRDAASQKLTLADFAKQEKSSVRFVTHLWDTLHQSSPTYPESEAVARWQKLAAIKDAAAARKEATALQDYIANWPRFFFGAGAPAEGGLGDERALVLTEDEVQARKKGRLRFNIINRSRDQKKYARVYLSTASLNPAAKDPMVLHWKNAMLRTRTSDKAFGPPSPLAAALDEESKKRLGMGPNETDFTTKGEVATYFDIPLADAGGVFELQVELEAGDGDAITRALLCDREDYTKGRPVSAVIGDPKHPSYKTWKAGIMSFADRLPSASHGEPTPADKDAIPAPYNNTYNQPERDLYHVTVKYWRVDRFIYDHILDDAQRKALDHAWNDLLGSFDYHDRYAAFVASKYKADLGGKTVAQLDDATIAQLPAEARKYIATLKAEHTAMRDAWLSAEPGHLKDCLELAAQAWRRPLSEAEKQSLIAFYQKQRTTGKMDHEKAIRLLVARILVAPQFLYRLENAANADRKRLSNWELATRLSYFLWASVPDEDLRRAAAANELTDPVKLQKQATRMLADAKARRFAVEFFGQWLGFYRFDQFTGVDSVRFPEFNDDLKAAMYEEAVTFFTHLVRENRPVHEILDADYTFANPVLAKHYGLKQTVTGNGQKVEKAENRGGILRMGVMHATTSAPLRTSPVKRGDWMLRRILGTPTPPPPADAGSLPSDEKQFGGLTLAEKLALHQRNATCAACHTRIDPLGFPLESLDPVGKVRQAYFDGKPISDSSTTTDKVNLKGVDSLIAYLKTQNGLVLSNFSRKLIGYALGRTTLASDQPLVDRMVAAGDTAPVAKYIAEIVASPQFRHRKEEDQQQQRVAMNNEKGKSRP